MTIAKWVGHRDGGILIGKVLWWVWLYRGNHIELKCGNGHIVRPLIRASMIDIVGIRPQEGASWRLKARPPARFNS